MKSAPTDVIQAPQVKVRNRTGPKRRDITGRILDHGEIVQSTGRQNRKVSSSVVPKAHRGTFHPEYIGVVHRYPKTLEEYEANRQRGRDSFKAYHDRMGHYPNRHGVPDGWGGKNALLKKVRSDAKIEAKEIMKIMTDTKIIPEGMDPLAHEALEFAVGVVRAKNPENDQPAYAIRDHLAASRLVLEYTHTKPATTSNVTLATAESFLEGLVGRKEK